jgi:transcriptional regulator with XRE-family HTH domain
MYGAFIKKVRHSTGLTQLELSAIVGIEQPNLSAYENDRQMPSVDALNRILVGCGYLMEATAGTRRIICPLPMAGWFADDDLQSEAATPEAQEQAVSIEPYPNDELSAAKLEQVLSLADSIRWAKTGS